MTTVVLIQGINERANTGLGEQSREVEVQRNVVLLKHPSVEHELPIEVTLGRFVKPTNQSEYLL